MKQVAIKLMVCDETHKEMVSAWEGPVDNKQLRYIPLTVNHLG
jgi:hypothetical protein